MRRLFDSFFIQVVIISWSLSFGELVFSQHGHYVYSQAYSPLISVGLFSSFSLGSLFGLTTWGRRLGAMWASMFASVLLFACYLLIFHWPPGLFPVVGLLILPFFGHGMFFSIAFSNYPLKPLIVALGLGGLACYVNLIFLYQTLGTAIIAVSCLAPLLVCALYGERWLRSLAFGLGAGLLIYGTSNGFLNYRTAIETIVPGFSDAKKIKKTNYTPLIQTDLVFVPHSSMYFILTNGNRFSNLVGDDHLPTAAASPSFDSPYLLQKPKKVLIIGSAGGANVLAALRGGAEDVWAVDINPQVFALAKEMSGVLDTSYYFDPRVHRIAEEGRHFLETTKETFDLIVLQGVQTNSASHFLNTAVMESYLYTEESLQKMWSHLNPNGSIFLEEFRLFQNRDTNHRISLMELAERELMRLSGHSFTTPHVLHAHFYQSIINPLATAGRRLKREWIFASRDPVSVNASLANQFPLEDEFRLVRSKAKDEATPSTDQHPFVIDQKALPWNLYKLLAFVATIILCAVAATIWLTSPTLGQKREAVSMALQGGAFVFFVSSILGPSTLIIGYPELTTPVVYSSLFFFSTVGGLIALKLSPQWRKNSFNLAAFTLALVGLMYLLFKQSILSSTHNELRFTMAIAFIGLGALVTELPYIAALEETEGSHRSWIFTYGKLGLLAGFPFAVLVQLTSGIYASFLISIGLYLLAGAVRNAVHGRVALGN